LRRHGEAAFNGSYVESVRSSAFGQELTLNVALTGLRGFSRRSG